MNFILYRINNFQTYALSIIYIKGIYIKGIKN